MKNLCLKSWYYGGTMVVKKKDGNLDTQFIVQCPIGQGHR